MSRCTAHPEARRGARGRCLVCHNAASDADRRRRVEAGLPLTRPMTDEQRARKRAADRKRYAENAEREKARQRDLYHRQALERELAMIPTEAQR